MSPVHFFFLITYFWEREGEGQRTEETEDPKQPLHWRQQAPHWARTHELWDHGLSLSQMLNRLSHSGAPTFFFLRGEEDKNFTRYFMLESTLLTKEFPSANFNTSYSPSAASPAKMGIRKEPQAGMVASLEPLLTSFSWFWGSSWRELGDSRPLESSRAVRRALARSLTLQPFGVLGQRSQDLWGPPSPLGWRGSTQDPSVTSPFCLCTRPLYPAGSFPGFELPSSPFLGSPFSTSPVPAPGLSQGLLWDSNFFSIPALST